MNIDPAFKEQLDRIEAKTNVILETLDLMIKTKAYLDLDDSRTIPVLTGEEDDA